MSDVCVCLEDFVLLPPVEPVKLEDIADDLTQYDEDYQAKTGE